MKMSYFIRRTLPIIIGSILGIIMLLNYFTGFDIFTQITGVATNWVVIISAVTVALGLSYMSNALLLSYRRDKTTLNLIYLIIPYFFFFAMLITGLIYPGGTNSPQYHWWFANIYQQVGATVYAVMFFTLASSAYRTFTVSSAEAISLLIGGIVYTLRQVALFTVYFPWIAPFGDWVLLIGNVAGGRGPVITAAIAALVVGIRTLWGKEVTLEAA
jgi:hypothetical protein